MKGLPTWTPAIPITPAERPNTSRNTLTSHNAAKPPVRSTLVATSDVSRSPRASIIATPQLLSQLQSPTRRRNALRRQSSYCVDVASSSVPSADRPHGPPGSADHRGTAAVWTVERNPPSRRATYHLRYAIGSQKDTQQTCPTVKGRSSHVETRRKIRDYLARARDPAPDAGLSNETSGGKSDDQEGAARPFFSLSVCGTRQQTST